jgi:A/G-specific adenine glycosylase
MLQQTRVAAVLEHYARFLNRFPDIHALARARVSSVLACWSGLGYYRRARLMHAAARQIVRERDGIFPGSAVEWRALPGIGRYTAAAIASICFGERCAVVDGNVERVLTRLSGGEPADFWAAADHLLSPSRPGDFNQAMMELGALVCTPRSPACGACPLRRWCAAARDTKLPAARAAQSRSRQVLGCALVTRADRVLLVQRAAEQTVMPGLWELPSINPAPERADYTLRHSIMNTDFTVRVIRQQTVPPIDKDTTARWFTVSRARKLPLTGLTGKILKTHLPQRTQRAQRKTGKD